MNLRRGFTLVELLGVITLIALLGLISVPIINTSIKNSKQKAFKQTLNLIVEAAKIYNADTDYLEMTDNTGLNVLSSKIEYENKSQIKGGYIYYKNSNYYFTYIYTDDYCATGYINDLSIYEMGSSECNDLTK